MNDDVAAENARRAELREAYRVTFNNPHGRLVLDDLLDRHGYVTLSAIAPGRSDQTAGQVGEQRVVFEILKRLTPEGRAEALLRRMIDGDEYDPLEGTDAN